MPTISIIVAMDLNGVIGHNGKLPWHLPGDLKWFKEKTWGKVVIMGRRTFESLGRRPLPGRRNIVVTSTQQHVAGVECVPSLNAALELFRRAPEWAEVFIIGGAQLYAEALPVADRVYVTAVEGDHKGDTKFPVSIDEISREFPFFAFLGGSLTEDGKPQYSHYRYWRTKEEKK